MSDGYSKHGDSPSDARRRERYDSADRFDARGFERSTEDTRASTEAGEPARRFDEREMWNDRNRRSERVHAYRDHPTAADDSRYGRDRNGGEGRGRYPDIGPRTSGHSTDTDYSGLSFGGGHRTDDHVYSGGSGLEAGYMAPPTPEYRRSTWDDERSREAGRHTPNPYESRADRPVDRHAWWQDRADPGPYVGRGPRGYQRSDERIREELNDRLTAHGYVDATDIECEVANGEVTLTGYVSSRRAKHMAEDVAGDIPGVRDVHNQLRIRTSAGEEGVGRTSVLGLTESETQNTAAARAVQPPDRTRSRG